LEVRGVNKLKPQAKTDAEKPDERVNAIALPLLLDEHKTAAFLGVSLSYLRKSRCEGTVGNRTEAPPFVRVGGRVLYKAATLETWVAALSERATI
jgi:hypothetical protein